MRLSILPLFAYSFNQLSCTRSSASALLLVKEKLAALTDWSAEPIHAAINDTATELALGMGKVGMPLRVAATGGGNSPSLDITLALLDKDKVLSRIDQALVVVEERIANS